MLVTYKSRETGSASAVTKSDSDLYPGPDPQLVFSLFFMDKMLSTWFGYLKAFLN